MSERNFKEWFIAERARALALVLLTRREDLDIRATTENGLDYTACIKTEEGAGDRAFGLLIRGSMSPVTIAEANAQLKPLLKHLVPDRFFVPVCVFYFTVKDDRGYYTWIHEPIVEKGHARLRPRAEPSCHPLDDDSLEEIVALVRAWYDALYTSLRA